MFSPNSENISTVERGLARMRPFLNQVKEGVEEISGTDTAFPAAHIGIASQMIEYHELLEEAVARRNIELAAWATRGLLEMRVWVQYLLAFPNERLNLERNYWVDQVQILDSIGTAFSQDKTSIPDWQVLRKEAAGHVKTYQTKLIRTAEMVKELGLEAEYFPLNSLLSKLVHPSAFSIVSRAKGAGGTLGFLSFIALRGIQETTEICQRLGPMFRPA